MSAVPRIKVLRRADEIPRALHDEMSPLFLACYAEAGYPISTVWNEALRSYVNVPAVPEDVRHRAAKLVCDRVGLPYEITGWVDPEGAA